MPSSLIFKPLSNKLNIVVKPSLNFPETHDVSVFILFKIPLNTFFAVLPINSKGLSDVHKAYTKLVTALTTSNKTFFTTTAAILTANKLY